MHEQGTAGRALAPSKASALALQAADRRLAIVAQLQQEAERRRWVALLKRIGTGNALSVLSGCCRILDYDLLKRFDGQWDWNQLSYNPSLPWSVELLDKYVSRWNWDGVSRHHSLPWSMELLERYEDRWNWEVLSRNESLPWSLKLLERFEGRWDWKMLSKSLPWSLELLEQYEDRWDWKEISDNESLPWSLELLEQYEDRWNWWNLSFNGSLPWSLEMLARFEHRWHWDLLSANQSLPWSLDLVKRFQNKWKWGPLPCSTEVLSWLENNWEEVGPYGNVIFSLKFIQALGDRSNLSDYIYSEWIPWSEEVLEFIERHEDDWWLISLQRIRPWSMQLLERFEERWDWGGLSSNSSLSWSLEMLERFESRLNWKAVVVGRGFPEPVVLRGDVIDVMLPDSHVRIRREEPFLRV